MPDTHIVQHRVRYSDTDHFGVVYYGTYLNWLEAGRTEILRANNISNVELEKQGIFAPVTEVHMNYKSPARYDDLIDVETKITHIGNSSIRFEYKLTRHGKLIATGHTINVCVGKDMQKVNVPDNIRSILA